MFYQLSFWSLHNLIPLPIMDLIMFSADNNTGLFPEKVTNRDS